MRLKEVHKLPLSPLRFLQDFMSLSFPSLKCSYLRFPLTQFYGFPLILCISLLSPLQSLLPGFFYRLPEVPVPLFLLYVVSLGNTSCLCPLSASSRWYLPNLVFQLRPFSWPLEYPNYESLPHGCPTVIKIIITPTHTHTDTHPHTQPSLK